MSSKQFCFFLVLGAYGMREVKYMAETGHIGPI